MSMMNDWDLLQQYANSRSEAAFAELVRRHLAWVHSVALRHVHDSQVAEDVTQSVFALLARKAGRLRSGTILSGWLFRTTCHVGKRARRTEQSRKNREQAASTMSVETFPPNESDAFWERLAPHLDPAVAHLNETDRTAVLLRFYLRKPFHEIGQQLGLSEDAAKKRVARAVEKLRSFLAARRLGLSATALTALLSQRTVQAVPAALARKAIHTAGTGLAVSAALPRLAQETLAGWRWAKIKLFAATAGGSAVLIFLTFVPNDWRPVTETGAESTLRAAADQVLASTRGAPDNVPFVPMPTAALPASRIEGGLAGVVLDHQGRPVVGAKVWGGFEQKPFAETSSDRSGEFALGIAPGPTTVTVTADGFAADQQEFDSANPGRPLVFRLQPIPSLNIRLVNESGQGVAGGRIFLATWWGRSGTLAQNLAQRTDDDGRFNWRSPPKGELQMEFGQTGYRWSRANKLFADGQARTITLQPTATVSGRVVDAESGEPLAQFKRTLGYAQRWNTNNPIPVWEPHSKAESNGFYSVLIEEEQPTFLQVEAAGYQTVQAAIPLGNAVDFTYDFTLQRVSATNLIRGLVLEPNGRPAVGVEVALCTDQVGVMLNGTSFSQRAFGRLPDSQTTDYRKKTDEEGFFWFEGKPGAHTVAAVGPSGFAQVRCFDSSTPLRLQLGAWARIRGTIRTRDGAHAGRTIRWARPGHLTSWRTVETDRGGFATVSDSSGTFTIEHVPPGDGRVALESISDGPVYSRPIRLAAGETHEVELGGIGRAVVGKLAAPKGVTIRSWTNQVTGAQLHVKWDRYDLPKTLAGQAIERWKLEFEDTPEGQAWFRDQYTYEFKVREDGSFLISEALPGVYRLFINVAQGNLGSGTSLRRSNPGDPTIASTGIQVVVPPCPDGDCEPVNLGEIVLIAIPQQNSSPQ